MPRITRDRPIPISTRTKLQNFLDYVARHNLLPDNSTDTVRLLQAYATKIRSGIIPEPFSLEIHPHLPESSRCINACRPCTGQAYEKGANFETGIPEEALRKLVHDVTHLPDGKPGMRIPKFMFAGNCTEPLLYPALHGYVASLLEAGSHVSLLTNMILGSEGDFLTFTNPGYNATRFLRTSFNAATPSDYDYFHRPNIGLIAKTLEKRGDPLQPGERIFERVTRNVERLAQLRIEKSVSPSQLMLALNFLLYPGNDKEPEIADLIRWADRIGIDSLEFRMPQVPQTGAGDFAPLSLDQTNDMRGFLSAQAKLTTKLKVHVSVTDPFEETKPKSFTQCWTRFIFAVIGFDGGLYPCTSVAAPQMAAFSEGNLNKQPDFWALWNNPERITRFKDFSPQKECDPPLPGSTFPAHVCTRTEFTFNDLLDNIKSGIV